MTDGPKIAIFDIETTGRNPQFKCGSVYSDSLVEYYDDAQRMLNDMRSLARKRYTFVAHNAEYDGSILFWKQGEDFAITYLNGMYSCGHWRYGPGKRTAPVWDSIRLSAGLSLQSLGESIGIEKYPLPRKLLDSEDVRQDWVCEEHGKAGCIKCYNLRDSEIVWSYLNMLREWLEPHGVVLKKSMPSMAVALWQIWDPNQQQSLKSPVIRKFAREAYYGGRTEAFRVGSCGPVTVHDIRSHYGSILSRIGLPDLGSLTYQENLHGTHIPDTGEGICEATVEVGSQFAPPLPTISDGRTYFPTGTIRACWPLGEIRNALDHGVQVHRVHRIAASERLLYPFATTARILLELREDFRSRHDPRQLIPKFLINAIVGRLGLREDHNIETYRRYHPKQGRISVQNVDLESAGGALYVVSRHSFSRVSPTANVLWAACICGAGRVRLLQEMDRAGERLIYVDTDSVHSTQTLVTGPDQPGQLVNAGEYDQSLYLGPKLYRLSSYLGNEEVRAKGIPRKQAAEFLASGRTSYQAPLRVVESIARGIAPQTWIDVERIGRTAPGGRVILDPTALHRPDAWSKTVAHHFSLESSE